MEPQAHSQKDTSETDRKSSIKVSSWGSCYDDNWNGLIVPEAFSHPAKFAPGLIRRIYQHCLAQGYLRKGDTVVDPFGGIGSGGIFAAPMGLKWVGCELEARFAGLAGQNFAMHESAWRTMSYPLPVICTGDPRRLSEIIGQADIVTTSPPYIDTSLKGQDPERQMERIKAAVERGEITGRESVRVASKGFNINTQLASQGDNYGTSPGQIGTLKAGSVDAVCTSPPFQEQKAYQIYNESKGFHSYDENEAKNRCKRNYLPGEDPSNIGNLRAGDVGAVVTSPPWENQEPSHAQGTGFQPAHDGNRKFIDSEYGCSQGQLGQTSGETYWQAVSQVYSECHKILKSGGVLVVVVKAYIKNKRRVPLPQQTLKLLIHLGFTPLERIKAMLVKEEVTDGLFGEMRKTKERKSFFRRLAEKKGSPKIN